jgi:hypothetical protein
MAKITTAARALFCLLMAGLPAAAHAQIGSGWTRYSPSFDVHRQGSGTYSKSGDTETFALTATGEVGKTGHRSEIRLHNNYTSGQRQFEGHVKVLSGGNLISLKQTMRSGGRAFFMFAVRSASGGQFYDHGNSGAGAFMSGVHGKSVRVNTIHDRNGNVHRLYLNGSLKETRTTPAGTWSEKYGAYKSLSGLGPVRVQWSGVRFWRK